MQGFEPDKVTFHGVCKHRLAHDEDKEFTIETTTGPSNICPECADVMLRQIWSK